MNTIDSKTPPTEFSWVRAAIYGAIMMVTWLVVTLLLRLLTSWDNLSTPGIPFAIVVGIVFEYLRRDGVRKKQ